MVVFEASVVDFRLCAAIIFRKKYLFMHIGWFLGQKVRFCDFLA